MKILTTYIPPTSGSATVCGFDVIENAKEVRKRIGYLPEHNPLYKDMFIREYLRFISGIHKLSNVNAKVEELIEMTGLVKESHKKIGSLSKGYRQRVGLAQAMIHNPEVLILDEPTTGLDPNQLLEIRSLIKNLGREKTVIFSSHIMQEVQALCDRVVIINNGKIVANASIDVLTQYQLEEQLLIVQFDVDPGEAALLSIEGVKSIKKHEKNKYYLICQIGEEVRKAIFSFAVSNRIVLLELRSEDYSIEDVFQKLTK